MGRQAAKHDEPSERKRKRKDPEEGHATSDSEPDVKPASKHSSKRKRLDDEGACRVTAVSDAEDSTDAKALRKAERRAAKAARKAAESSDAGRPSEADSDTDDKARRKAEKRAARAAADAAAAAASAAKKKARKSGADSDSEAAAGAGGAPNGSKKGSKKEVAPVEEEEAEACDVEEEKARRKAERRARKAAAAAEADKAAAAEEAAAAATAAARKAAAAAEGAAVGTEGEAEAEDSKVSRTRRKLERALRRGDAERVAQLTAKLGRCGATAASIGATLAGDESAMEAALRGEHAQAHAGVGASDAGAGAAASRGAGAVPTSSSSSAAAAAAAAAGAGSAAASAAAAAAAADLPTTGIVAAEAPAPGWVLARNGKWYPPPKPQTGNTTLLLFYAYVRPPWNARERAAAIEYTHKVLSENGCTGRLRVALEGFNSTLTGPRDGIRAFTQALREYDPKQFGAVDFKYVDGLPDNKMFKALKVWPVTELVNYGFDPAEGRLEFGGTHVKPDVWTDMSKEPGVVMIDIRNANETAIGSFRPPDGGAELLDPRMRRSTEFPGWVAANLAKLKGASKIMTFCTAGIRCERASAFLREKGLDNIFQLEGGIHRYLDAYPEDGGIWKGKNYVFDRRFAHGAEKCDVVSVCAGCNAPWDRYQAQARCSLCTMETLLCRDCQRAGMEKKKRLLCWVCAESKGAKGADAARAAAAARAFAASGGGRDGEGEGKAAAEHEEDDGPGGGGGGRGGGFGGRGGFRGGRGGHR